MISSSYFAEHRDDVAIYLDGKDIPHVIKNGYIIDMTTSAILAANKMAGGQLLPFLNATPTVFLPPEGVMTGGGQYLDTLATDGRYLYVCPKFVFFCLERANMNRSIGVNILAMVVMHECYHNILGHPKRGIPYNDDPRLPWAVDIEVNCTMALAYPSGHIEEKVVMTEGQLENYPDGSPILNKKTKMPWQAIIQGEKGGSPITEHPFAGKPFEEFIDSIQIPPKEEPPTDTGGTKMKDDPAFQDGYRDGYNEALAELVANNPSLLDIIDIEKAVMESMLYYMDIKGSINENASYDEMYAIGKGMGAKAANEMIKSIIQAAMMPGGLPASKGENEPKDPKIDIDGLDNIHVKSKAPEGGEGSEEDDGINKPVDYEDAESSDSDSENGTGKGQKGDPNKSMNKSGSGSSDGSEENPSGDPMDNSGDGTGEGDDETGSDNQSGMGTGSDSDNQTGANTGKGRGSDNSDGEPGTDDNGGQSGTDNGQTQTDTNGDTPDTGDNGGNPGTDSNGGNPGTGDNGQQRTDSNGDTPGTGGGTDSTGGGGTSGGNPGADGASGGKQGDKTGQEGGTEGGDPGSEGSNTGSENLKDDEIAKKVRELNRKLANAPCVSTKSLGKKPIMSSPNNVISQETGDELRRESGYDDYGGEKMSSQGNAQFNKRTLKELMSKISSAKSGVNEILGGLIDNIADRLSQLAAPIKNWPEILKRFLHSASGSSSRAGVIRMVQKRYGVQKFHERDEYDRGHEAVLVLDVSGSMHNELPMITEQVNNILISTPIEYLRVMLFDGGVTPDGTPSNCRIKVKRNGQLPSYTLPRAGGGTNYAPVFRELSALYDKKSGKYRRSKVDAIMIFTDTALVESGTRDTIPVKWDPDMTKKLIWVAIANDGDMSEMKAPIGYTLNITWKELRYYTENNYVKESRSFADAFGGDDDDDMARRMQNAFGDVAGDDDSYVDDTPEEDKVEFTGKAEDVEDVKVKLYDRARTLFAQPEFRRLFIKLMSACLKEYGFTRSYPYIIWNDEDRCFDLKLNDLIINNGSATASSSAWRDAVIPGHNDKPFTFINTASRNIGTLKMLIRSIIMYAFGYESWNMGMVKDEDAVARCYDDIVRIESVGEIHIANQDLSGSENNMFVHCDDLYVDNCRVRKNAEGMPVINILPRTVVGTVNITNLEGFVIDRSKTGNQEYVDAVRAAFPKAASYIVKGGYAPASRALMTVLNKK